MTNSTNDVLEQGIQEVGRLTKRIATLAEQEEAFRGVASSLDELGRRIEGVRNELSKLDTASQRRRWNALWWGLGGLALLHVITILFVISKS